MAYGYKPSDLIHITAQDVLDFKRGLSARLDVELNMLWTAAEIAAGTKVRKAGPQSEKYSNKVRRMIEEENRKDRLAGKIKN